MRALIKFTLINIAFLMFAGAGFAEKIVGTTVLGGKRVQLLDDGTWRFEEKLEQGTCLPITTVLTFCGTILDWRPTSAAGTDFDIVYTHDDRHYAGVILEGLGSNDDFSLEFMRSAVLENAALETGNRVENIPVLEITDSEIDGHIGETIIYGVRIDGVAMVFSNTVMVSQDLTVQAITWAVGKEYTDKHKNLHIGFLDQIKLNIEEEVQ